MAAPSCDCCHEPRPAAATLRRRLARQGGRLVPRPTAADWEHALCFNCTEWLTNLILEARRQDGSPIVLFGAPATNGRALVFEDQCQVCRNLLGPGSSLIEWIDRGSARRPWLSFVVCPSCEGWIASLADDGRSARGEAWRELDGAYGDWLHPNLRQLRADVDVADDRARATILHTCETMGVEAMATTLGGEGDALFVEAARCGYLREGAGARYRALILLVPLHAQDDLVANLDAGISDWLTVPVTPQQVTAALGRSLRRWRHRLPWDAETALPMARLDGEERSALEIEPAPGMDRFELAWLLKRFSRGYDEVVVADGVILLLPRVAPRNLEAVAARLERLFPGRCLVRPFTIPVQRPRFEAIG